MKTKLFLQAAVCLAAFSITSAASSAVLVEALPTSGAPQVGIWVNKAGEQNFLVQFTLAADSEVTGFSIVTASLFASVGTSVTFKLRADNAGNPHSINAYSFTDTIDSIDAFSPNGLVLATVNFAPITLTAGTYWAGLSGTINELGWSSFNNGGPNTPTDQRQLAGNEVTSLVPSISDLAYRVLGENAAPSVPEPASWALMIAGFGFAGAALRRGKPRYSARFA